VLWRGKSKLNGDDIVAIATGLQKKSTNRKTGAMIQTWILPEKHNPSDAIRSGADESICGSCIHRNVGGIGTCYVNVGWGPTGIWKAYHEGRYPDINKEIVRSIKTHHVRIGAYGDPVAVPSPIWRSILPVRPRDATGYTHQLKHPDARHYKDYLMASCDNEAEVKEAKADGWRTFLVVPQNKGIPKGFVHCPSDDWFPGNKVLCEDCGACSGTRGGTKDVAIYAHGRSAGRVGSLARKSNTPITKKKNKHEPLVRMRHVVHEAMKDHCRKHRIPMKRWVELAVMEKIAEERKAASSN
jgi:hypothetical protein